MAFSFQWMQNAKIMLAIPVLPLKESVSKLVEFTFTWLSLDGNRAHRSQMCLGYPDYSNISSWKPCPRNVTISHEKSYAIKVPLFYL